MSTLVRQVKAIPVRGAAMLAATLAVASFIAIALGAAIGDAWRASAQVGAALGASALAGAATGLGALAIVFLPTLTTRLRAGLLGFSGGVMLTAALVSLLWPAFDIALAVSRSSASALALVATAALAGALVIRGADRLLPHAHPGLAGADAKLWLMVVAIALHNVPEGFAVGASYAGGEALGISTALAIGLQNVPEGLVVAAALAMLGYAPLTAVAVSTLTGLAEPLGAVVGIATAGSAALALPIALAAAGGAMLFVVLHELFPGAIRLGYTRIAVVATYAGVGLMLALGAV